MKWPAVFNVPDTAPDSKVIESALNARNSVCDGSDISMGEVARAWVEYEDFCHGIGN